MDCLNMNAPSPDDISIAWQSGELNNSNIQVAVTLPTFRRPEHLLTTLQSVAAQNTNVPFVCIVMENDPDNGEGAIVAEDFFKNSNLSGIVVRAHRRGNCSAYNAGWHTALATFPNLQAVLVIDDDEIAIPSWLDSMLAARTKFPADMVGAPQIPVFEAGSRDAMRLHPVFQPAYETSGPVPIIYSSGNVMIGANVLRDMGYPYLDERFNFLGGGDSDFYARCKEKGYTFGWCSEAPVHETMPARRTKSDWLNFRGIRNGSISALIEIRAAAGLPARLKIWAKTFALLAASPFRSLALFIKTGSPIISIYHVNVALGRLLMEFGFAKEQYREPEKN